ncbi:AMP-binding protein [Bacillus subtilis]|uniref:AMP-binding protein n=1 Tax=Bacillus subtilis TaxID=1423 RepID=UPI003EBD7575
MLTTLQPEASIIRTSKGQVKPSDILNTGLFDFEKSSASAGWIKEINAGHSQHTPETEEYNISSFVYERRLPFHTSGLNHWLDRDYPKHLSIPELFNERVKAQPDHLALVEGDRTFTYEELGEEIHRLAGSLIEKGVQPGDAVAVYMNRSADAVIAILAVLHAGAAYVPIDPSQPEERIRWMLEDSGATILLHADSPPPVDEQIKTVHVTSKPHHLHMDVSVRTSPSHLAYIKR